MLNKLTKIKRLLLIGKEIWHNKRSMRGRFIIYLLSLVLLAGSAMLILLNVIGIVQPPLPAMISTAFLNMSLTPVPTISNAR